MVVTSSIVASVFTSVIVLLDKLSQCQDELKMVKKLNALKVRCLQSKVRRMTTKNEHLKKHLERPLSEAACIRGLSEYLSPRLLVDLVTIKIAHKHKRDKFKYVGSYPAHVKEWAQSIYRLSPRVYSMLEDIFFLPSIKALRRWARNQLLASYKNNQLSTNSEKPTNENNSESAPTSEATTTDAALAEATTAGTALVAEFDYSEYEITTDIVNNDSWLQETESNIKTSGKRELAIPSIDKAALAKKFKGLFC